MDETAHFMDETAHFMDEYVTFQSYGSKVHFMDETAKLMEKKNTRPCFITGLGGSGKTTLLKQIQSILTKQDKMQITLCPTLST
jgi:ABC-type lipoprotein export system ATPase subunit